MSFKVNIIVFLAVVIVMSTTFARASSLRETKTRHSRFIDIVNALFPPVCTGCPMRFCDNDPAINLGYCCGCRRTYDILPVLCNPATYCPGPNFMHDVCRDYEYMMHCCC